MSNGNDNSEPGPTDNERDHLEAHVDACAKRYWHLDRQHRKIKRLLWTAIWLMVANTGVASQSLGFKNLMKWVFGL